MLAYCSSASLADVRPWIAAGQYKWNSNSSASLAELRPLGLQDKLNGIADDSPVLQCGDLHSAVVVMSAGALVLVAGKPEAHAHGTFINL